MWPGTLWNGAVRTRSEPEGGSLKDFVLCLELSPAFFYRHFCMNKRAIFVAATGQNVGKTTVCLGMIAGLHKRFSSVGFIKPVGQQHVAINDQLKVDKDAVLFHEHFHLSAPYEDMSPIIIPPGYTRDFLDGAMDTSAMEARIISAFQRVGRDNDYTIVEGTGHVGVGSIIGLSNAKVASLLGLEMVIIAQGGLGSAYDELSLNIELCQHYNVPVRGVILNRVLDDKREMILNYFPKALARYNIPLLGCIPYNAFLSTPTMEDFETHFNTTMLSGQQYRYRHFRENRLVAGSLEAFLKEEHPKELIITPASRDDIIQAILSRHTQAVKSGEKHKVGLLLTGRQPPNPNTLAGIRNSDIPAIYAPVCSYTAMKRITSFTAKIRKEDVHKVATAISLVENHINFDQLCQHESLISS